MADKGRWGYHMPKRVRLPDCRETGWHLILFAVHGWVWKGHCCDWKGHLANQASLIVPSQVHAGGWWQPETRLFQRRMKNAELNYLFGLFQREKNWILKLNYFLRNCNSIFDHGKKSNLFLHSFTMFWGSIWEFKFQEKQPLFPLTKEQPIAKLWCFVMKRNINWHPYKSRGKKIKQQYSKLVFLKSWHSTEVMA